jgi:hypothetical protein
MVDIKSTVPEMETISDGLVHRMNMGEEKNQRV